MIIDHSSYFNNEITKYTFAVKGTGNILSPLNDTAKNLGYNSNSLAIPQQVHSTNILFVNSSGRFENCDGLITNNPDVVLSLQTADCIPIFLYDSVNGLYGLVHAGWRGIVRGIVNNAIKLMVKYQSTVKDIQVVLGPAICKDCFEVGKEVVNQFDEECVAVGNNGKYFVDLNSQVKVQLQKQKISANKIYLSNICTFENNNCCSYRRDGEDSGRMYSFMGMKNEYH